MCDTTSEYTRQHTTGPFLCVLSDLQISKCLKKCLCFRLDTSQTKPELKAYFPVKLV